MTNDQNGGKLPSPNATDTQQAIQRAKISQTALSKHLQAIKDAKKNKTS